MTPRMCQPYCNTLTFFALLYALQNHMHYNLYWRRSGTPCVTFPLFYHTRVGMTWCVNIYGAQAPSVWTWHPGCRCDTQGEDVSPRVRTWHPGCVRGTPGAYVAPRVRTWHPGCKRGTQGANVAPRVRTWHPLCARDTRCVYVTPWCVHLTPCLRI